MKLNLSQIKSIVKGAAFVEESDGKIGFYRFTEPQMELYKAYDKDFYRKCFASSGIRLEFKTDSEFLKIKIKVKAKSSRKFSTTSVYANNKLSGRINLILEGDEFSYFDGGFSLGKGEKTVFVYLPWSSNFILESMEIDDESYLLPVDKKLKGIIFGDSITQGYDALNPENSYANQIADYFNAECINKGIGGEIFFPNLAKEKDNFNPDFITVAYGTNDFGRGCGKKDFDARCEEFYKNLSETYFETKIFALSPIRRRDDVDNSEIKDLFYVRDKIFEISKKLSNVIFIDCFDFVPDDEKYFSDKVLHPNDEGFFLYSKKLVDELKKYI